MDKAAGLNVDYLNPFIEATVGSCKALAQIAAHRERMYLKDGGPDTYGLSGVLPLAGDVIGAVVVTFPETLATFVAGRIAGQEFTGISAPVVERIGELAGVIAGDARNRLGQKGYQVQVGPARILAGRSHLGADPGHGPCVVVEFACDAGRFRIECTVRKAG